MILAKLRKKIDNLDKNIIGFLNERAKIVCKIGALKKTRGIGVYMPDREKQIYKKITKLNSGPIKNESLRAIYREIMSSSLSMEKKVKVAYLGPPATFTHLASLKKFGSSVEYVTCNNISDVFCEVERARCDYGVVPVENSIEGAVNHTLDMLIDSDLKICSEVLLNISHNLLVGNLKEKIKKVYSNPQVFGQCRMWIESNLPGVDLIEVSSTTKAAQLAAKNKNSAAIASSLAAELYHLQVVSDSIEDSSHNITRFLVLAGTTALATNNDKTSIIFSIKDKIGALHEMLLPFKNNNINLTKIESRPSKRKAWDYYFIADFNGHYTDNKVKKALTELEKKCRFIKILGSYPVPIDENDD
ncbi:MAG: prephenate dehydratase [Candidatus Omnitrophota bacterium]